MSGDESPEHAVRAAIAVLKYYPALQITLVGLPEALEPCRKFQSAFEGRLAFEVAETVVRMSDRPAQVLRSREASSMSVALDLVCTDHAACVSAGNTGALMLLARAILKTHPGIDRPAIIKRIPSPYNACYMVDLGANVDCRAGHLFQFAQMGVAMVKAVEQVEQPRVALLNIGTEENKGNEQVRLAAKLLRECPDLDYAGFIEGHGLLTTDVNVVVCDGFVGNVALKSGEAVGRMFRQLLGELFAESLYAKAAAWVAGPVLRRFGETLNPVRHSGASFVGLSRTVVKCHGHSQQRQYESALHQAVMEATAEVPQKVNARLDEIL